MAAPGSVIVIGGGLVGGVAAIAFARLGYNVSLFEKRRDWKGTGEEEYDENTGEMLSVSKRSINLALSFRGQEALRMVGLYEEAMGLAVPMKCRAIHTVGSPVRVQPYDEIDSSNFINSISREDLNRLLLKKAEALPNITVTYNSQLVNIDRDGGLHFMEPQDRGTYNDCCNCSQKGAFTVDSSSARLVVGADGAYSAVREAMLRLQSTNFHREYITHGYKELTICPTSAGEYQLSPINALHIWPRGDFMMIALPNPDCTFTCTIFAPLDELKDLSSTLEIEEYFNTHFPDIIQYMPDYIEQFRRNPTCRLVMSKVDPWNYGNIILVGDAAHAQVPFFGQGMNAGMEDIVELCEIVKAHGDGAQAISMFADQRKKRGDAIIDMSLRNYMEMRSSTASRLFLFRKRIEGYFNWLLPKSWIPLYKMVAFTRIPYDEVIEREKKQDAILKVVSLGLIIGTGVLSSLVLLKWQKSNR